MTVLPNSLGPTPAMRMLRFHQGSIATSLERLATGKKINRASDDPTGIVAVDQFKVRITEINKKLDRFEFQESMLGATEGGLSVIQDQVLELQGLVVNNANTGGLSEVEKDSIVQNAQSIIEGIGLITTSTMFNGNQILVGRGPDLGGLVEALKEDPEKAQAIVDGAVESISVQRGTIGNQLKSIDSERRTLLAELEGNTQALSDIEDTDYAAETASLVRAQILEQATIQVIQVERQQADSVLDLIASVPGVSERARNGALG